MKKIFKIAIAATVLFLPSLLSAQSNFRTGYFLDGYSYKYRFNPSFQGDRGFISFPASGNLTVGVESNMGLSTFLYPTENGNLTTFLNSSVDDNVFLNGLSENNKLNVNLDMPVLALGFRTKKSYHTIDLSVKAGAGVNVPKSLFKFAKVGSADGTTEYNVKDFMVKADGRLELAYGYSRPLTSWLDFGVRLKFLAGVARAEVNLKEVNFKTAADEWSVKASGSLEASCGGLMLPEKTNDSGEQVIDFENIGFDMEGFLNSLRKPSFGGAIDLGLSAHILGFIDISAAMVDIGLISWNDVTKGVTSGNPWTFNGFGSISTDGGAGADFEQFGTELLNAFEFKKTSEGVKAVDWLAMTSYISVEVMMPFWKRLSFGLLATHRYDGPYSWTEGRLSVNIAPLNWLSLTANYALSDFGSSFGGALNIHAKGFNLFVGADSFLPLMEVTPQYIPVKTLNTSVAVGLNFPFGKYNGRFKK